MSNINQFPIPALPISQITPLASSTFSDILVADQGGVTGTETLLQAFNLFLPNMFLSYNGNPNGNVAGIAFQTCFNLATQILYVCTVSGNAMSAVWRQCIASSNLIWVDVTNGNTQMNSDHGYIADSAITTSLTLPSASSVGDIIYVVGRQIGWTILQNVGQKIFVSPQSSTTGATGSLSSLQAKDSVVMICTKANLEWQVTSQQSAGLAII